MSNAAEDKVIEAWRAAGLVWFEDVPSDEVGARVTVEGSDNAYQLASIAARVLSDDPVPAWWHEEGERVADLFAALIRRIGADAVEFDSSELAGRGPDEVVTFRYDDEGCARIEVTTEVPSEAE